MRFCDEVVVVDSGVHRPHPRAWPRRWARASCATSRGRGSWPSATWPWTPRATTGSWWWTPTSASSPELRDEILAARAAGFDRAGYRIPRVAFYLGRWIRGTDWYPDTQLRLFDRTRGRWHGGLVHESVRLAGAVGRLRAELQHHPYEDIAHHMRKIDAYTTLWAPEALEAGRRAGALEALGAAGWAFLRNYVLKGGFRLGEAGLTVSLLNAHYTHAKLAKLRELMRADGRGR